APIGLSSLIAPRGSSSIWPVVQKPPSGRRAHDVRWAVSYHSLRSRKRAAAWHFTGGNSAIPARGGVIVRGCGAGRHRPNAASGREHRCPRTGGAVTSRAVARRQPIDSVSGCAPLDNQGSPLLVPDAADQRMPVGVGPTLQL